ncbi:MAG: hypothetical protein K0R18_131 [Bacillales bacterium]|jgi:hypothetical protein|nr:hypothetical protein [Bacillales bacterium]
MQEINIITKTILSSLQEKAKELKFVVNSIFLNDDGSKIDKSYACDARTAIHNWCDRITNKNLWNSYFCTYRAGNFEKDLVSACRKIVRVLNHITSNKNCNQQYKEKLSEIKDEVESHLVMIAMEKVV